MVRATPAVHTATILTCRGAKSTILSHSAANRSNARLITSSDIVKHHFWLCVCCTVVYSARLVGFSSYFIISPLQICHQKMFFF